MMDVSFDNVGLLLSIYISNIGKQGRWLPILALVILWFELKYLMFQSPKKAMLEHQLSRQGLLQEYYGARWREIFLTILSTSLAWLLFFILLCQRKAQREAAFWPIRCAPCSLSQFVTLNSR